MSWRWLHAGLMALLVLSVLLTGCSWGAGKVTSLQLEASDNTLFFGETAQLNAKGVTDKGKTIVVVPDWEIISGSGSLSGSEFQASAWDYVGDVVLRATYKNISAELTISVQGLLGEVPDPFPKPASAFDFLPRVTEEFIVKIGEPVDYFTFMVDINMGRRVLKGRAAFVWDGQIVLSNPYPHSWVNPKLYEEIPEKPRLSHKVRFELIESMVLARGTNYERTVAHEKGTTFEEAQELASRITSESHAEAGWSWGKVETTLTLEFTKRTQQSIKLEQKEKVSRTWSFVNPNDREYYLYSSWNRVDIFYLSDSNGEPLETSPIFAGYGFTSFPVEIRGNSVVQKTWGFGN